MAESGRRTLQMLETSPLLSAVGIGKRFGSKVVLEGTSLEARAGEAVALVGENGAGKTTLLRICAGLIEAGAGRVRAAGRMGYCPQDPGVLDLLTADEHLAFFGTAMDLPRHIALEQGRGLLAEFGFPLHERAVVRDMSGGVRQKLNLALALLGDPQVLLLDEPYQGFDHGTYVNFWDHVDAWRNEGRAIVIVTHMLAELSGGACRRTSRPSLAVGRVRGGVSRRAVRTMRKLGTRLVMIAEMQGRDLMRRRVALALLFALPLAFYGALASSQRDDALIPGGIAMAFSVAGAAIFSVLSSRRVDQRLVLAGFGPWELVAGRLIFLEVVALPVAGFSAAVMAVVSSPSRPWVLGLAVWLVAFIAVPFGLAIGALVPVELEATLVLIGVVGVQLSLSGGAILARFLPFWGPRRLIDVALGDSFSVPKMVLVSLAYAAGLFALSLILMARRRSVHRPAPMHASDSAGV